MAWRNRNRAFDDQDDQDDRDDWARDQQALTDVLQENTSGQDRIEDSRPVEILQSPDPFSGSVDRTSISRELPDPLSGSFQPPRPSLVAMSSAFDGRERELQEPDLNVPTPPPTVPPPIGTDAARKSIADAYQRELGRAATGTEIDRWLSGAFGHGDATNLDPIMKAIGASGEAQAFRDRPKSIQEAYRRFLGREASPEEFASHVGNPGGFAGILNTIASSPEAQAYQARTTTGSPSSSPTAIDKAARDQIARGNVGVMSGFEQGDYGGDVKARTSVKNMFGRIAQRYANRPGSIDAILADPDFKRLFPNAKKVPGGAGDKIDFGGVLSDFETGTPVGIVDVLTQSDPRTNTAGAWWWNPEGAATGGGTAGAPTAGAPTANARTTGAGTTGAGMTGGSTADGGVLTPYMFDQQSALEQIQAEIDALMQGRGSQIDQRALMQMLGGM